MSDLPALPPLDPVQLRAWFDTHRRFAEIDAAARPVTGAGWMAGVVEHAGAGSPAGRFSASPAGDNPKSPRGLCTGFGTSHRWAR